VVQPTLRLLQLPELQVPCVPLLLPVCCWLLLAAAALQLQQLQQQPAGLMMALVLELYLAAAQVC
jgi:hypothetical protein